MLEILNETIVQDNQSIGRYTVQRVKITKELIYELIDCYDFEEILSRNAFNIQSFIESNNLIKDKRFLNKNVLFLDDFVINKQLRGNNLGSSLLKEIEDSFTKDIDYIVLRPFPINDGTEIIEDFDETYEKVCNFYKRNGYRTLNETVTYPFYYKKVKE